jgi:hypothetical protein
VGASAGVGDVRSSDGAAGSGCGRSEGEVGVGEGVAESFSCWEMIVIMSMERGREERA